MYTIHKKQKVSNIQKEAFLVSSFFLTEDVPGASLSAKAKLINQSYRKQLAMAHRTFFSILTLLAGF